MNTKQLISLAGFAVLKVASTVSGATIVVNDPTDSFHFGQCPSTGTGTCSLRDAITYANGSPGADVIQFALPGSGIRTLPLFAALPSISDALTIDGTSQPGFAGSPLIELDGTNAGAGTDGLVISAGPTTIQGLIINRFGANGVVLTGFATGITIAGSFIGTNATGTSAAPNGGHGINVGPAVGNSTIGGAAVSARNVISGNGQRGITILSSGNIQVRGNFIGTNAAGTAALPNGLDGILINGSGNTIGGTDDPGARNVISGNAGNGVVLIGSNVVEANSIGTNAAGTSALSNGADGILINGSGSAVGGTVAAAANVVAYNGGNGVEILNSASTGVSILTNSIHHSGNRGILLNGGNNNQSAPVLTAASISGSNAMVSGTFHGAASTSFRTEFFSNSLCASSGRGEGQTFLGFTTVTTDASGNASFGPLSFPAPANQAVITATATDPANNTSAFSACRTNVAPPARVFASISGNDGNVCSNIATPCRTISGGISQVDIGGEVIVLTSGSYGGLTIAKAVVVNVPPGVVAFTGQSITVAADPSDIVILRGLTLKAAVPGSGTGISFSSGKGLQVESCVVNGWATGIGLAAPGALSIKDTAVRNCTTAGVTLSDAGASLSIDRGRFEGNVAGLLVSAGKATVRRSLASGNTADGLRCDAGELDVETLMATGNGNGIAAGSAGTVRVSSSTVTENAVGLSQTGGGVLLSRTDNTVEGNTANTSGSITTYTQK
jgi:CSLREA domain-containing protein